MAKKWLVATKKERRVSLDILQDICLDCCDIIKKGADCDACPVKMLERFGKGE